MVEQVLRKMTLDFFGTGKHKITPEKLFETENVCLLDVRSGEEAGSISINMGYHANIECKNIPVNELPDRLEDIPREKLIAVFCPANVRSAMAYTYLLVNGFDNVRIVEGGYSSLTEAVLPGKLFKSIQNRK
jgi:rhodanese-related sulfurtransferase